MLLDQHLDHIMSHTFFFILLFSSILSTNIIQACDQTERSSLLSFSLSVSSPPLNWTSLNCCHWEGITCDQDGWITALHLPSRGLKSGNFPLVLQNLTHLIYLNLSHNSLYGSLDQPGSFFSSLNRLEVLDLSYNLLSGELPDSLPSRNMIRMVDFSSNDLHGVIPSSFFQDASNLTSFNANNNRFTGSIPSSICHHSSPFIRLLDFSFNKFSGNISSGLGQCSKLQVFRAGYNNLSGLVPEDIYNATTLEEITLPGNSLYGSISDRIVNLTNLAILDLYFNEFSGVLPLEVGKLSKLKLIILDFNHLEGSLPPSLMNCTNLLELRLGINRLEGDLSALDFSKLTQLTKLDLLYNNFTGTLPRSLYSCKSLKAIRLSRNDLEGQIEPDILSLTSLSFLSLGGIRLTNITGAMKILMHSKSLVALLFPFGFVGEEMPKDNDMTDFNGFENLQILGLSHCELTGQVPVWLSKLKKLQILDMTFNRLTGSVPSWLGTLPRLFYIDLSSNLLSGEFPKELCRLPMLVSNQTPAQVVDLNSLELPIFIQPNGHGLRTLQYNYLPYFPPSIYLRNNSISGNIPVEIGQLQRLHVLDLSINSFSGNIPGQISNLKNMEVLDLSMNHLSGEVPASLSGLSFLKSFNVSYNDLQGPIPTGTQLQSFNASAFEGNPKLCGAPLPHECSRPTDGIDEDKMKSQGVDSVHQTQGFRVSVALGFIVGFFGVYGPLMLKKTWRYEYFQFVDNVVQDRLYVIITVCTNKMQRKLRS